MTAINVLEPPAPSTNWKSALIRGYLVVAVTLFGFGGWSFVARVDSAVVAPGTISLETNRKTVQHLEGGIVSEILVRDGDVVNQGDVLVRLDPTRTQATGELYRKQAAAMLALEARLSAQRDMKETIAFPDEVVRAIDDPAIARTVADNKRQFESRRKSLLLGLDVIDKQISQTEQDIAQTRVDKENALQQLATIDRELPGLHTLLNKGLVALSRVTSLERQKISVQGEVARADIDFTKGQEKVAEARARAEELKQEYRQEAANSLPDVQKSLNDIRQQIVVAEDVLKRIDITAPVAGTVQQLRVFTLGGIIRPGDAILDIVPASDVLVVRAKISPLDVDRVHKGLSVEIQLPQFEKFQREVIRGTVYSVSRDSLVDEVTRQPYFDTEIKVDRSSIPMFINDKLSAGMTTTVVIPNGERTVLEYLVSPIRNRMSTSMHER